MDPVKEYILALINLYGQLPLEQVVLSYNQQNDEPIGMEDVERYYKEDLSKEGVYALGGHFVHESTVMLDRFDHIKGKQGAKPYYLPDKEELLKYADLNYIERPDAYYRLLDYSRKRFFKKEAKRAEAFSVEMLWVCTLGPSLDLLFFNFDKFDIDDKDSEGISQLLRLVMDLALDTRLWENRGHTPAELFDLYNKGERLADLR